MTSFALSDNHIFDLSGSGRPTSRAGAIAAVVALHVALLAAILQHEPQRRAIAEALPMTVTLIAESKPEPVAAKPLRMVRRSEPVIEPPVIAVIPPPPVVLAAAPAPEAPAITLPLAAPSPQAKPAAMPPRFNADYLRNPAPAYPVLAKRRGEQGKVLLRVLVGADGLAEKVELHTSSGFQLLDVAATDTVAHWRFVPAKLGDVAIADWVIVPISFTLRS
jgi:periplasmic protein TonB